MKCQLCETEYADTLNCCPHCGTYADPLNSQLQNNFMGGATPTLYSQAHTYTEKEFYNLPELALCKSNIKGSAILLYICATLNLFLSLIFSNPSMLIDVILIVVLGIILQTKKSRVASIILAIYACFNVFVLLIMTGRMGGYFYIIAAVWSIMYTFKYQAAWKKYQQTKILPAYFKKSKRR